MWIHIVNEKTVGRLLSACFDRPIRSVLWMNPRASVTVDHPLRRVVELCSPEFLQIPEVRGRNHEEYFDGNAVFFEMPANPYHEDSFESYPNIPEWYAEREAKTHTVLGFDWNWRVTADSRGNVLAWECGNERDISEAPSSLVTECENAIKGFPEVDTDEMQEVTGDLEQQLEDLGYL